MGFENLFWGLEFWGQFSAVLLLYFWGRVRMNCAARRLRGTLIRSRGFCQAWLRELGRFCSRDVVGMSRECKGIFKSLNFASRRS